MVEMIKGDPRLISRRLIKFLSIHQLKGQGAPFEAKLMKIHACLLEKDRPMSNWPAAVDAVVKALRPTLVTPVQVQVPHAV